MAKSPRRGAVKRRRTDLAITRSGRGEVVGHLLPMFVALDRLDLVVDDEERAVVERYLRGAIEAFEHVLGAPAGEQAPPAG